MSDVCVHCIINTCLIRLINLIADDNAIEDTIYHLHRALNAGRIDLERFLRVCSFVLSRFPSVTYDPYPKLKINPPISPMSYIAFSHSNFFLQILVNARSSRRAVHETRTDREDPE